ncbi:hypothetical protein [Nocardia sp. NPDC023988]|uniref:hypothetical protein n=1 Tax=unclassified Nocardia TaxID=2637762 RepID=UPI0033C5E352
MSVVGAGDRGNGRRTAAVARALAFATALIAFAIAGLMVFDAVRVVNEPIEPDQVDFRFVTGVMWVIMAAIVAPVGVLNLIGARLLGRRKPRGRTLVLTGSLLGAVVAFMVGADAPVVAWVSVIVLFIVTAVAAALPGTKRWVQCAPSPSESGESVLGQVG